MISLTCNILTILICSVEIGDKGKKLPNSTQNDDFKFWDVSEATKAIHEPPEITSKNQLNKI